MLAGAGFLLLAAETVRTHHVLRAKIPKLEKDLEIATQQLENLLHGSGDSQGVLDLEHQLQMVTRNRGRVWRNVMPAGQVDNQGIIDVEIPNPKPHGLAQGSIVYAFESTGTAQPAADGIADDEFADEAPVDENTEAPAEEGTQPAEVPAANPNARKQYLGEFRVIEVSETGVKLEPVLLIDQRTGQRLFESKGPWSLYETMPVDRHEIFADLPEEELRQLLPAETVDQFLRHGKPADPNDNPLDRIGLDENDQRVDHDQAVKFLYDRPLRDYGYLFADLAQKKVLLQARIQAVTEDNAKLTASIEGGKKLGQFRQQQKKLLEDDLAGMQADRQAIEVHLQQLQQMLANAAQQIEGQLEENSQNADRYTAHQLDLLQNIDTTAPAPLGAETATP